MRVSFSGHCVAIGSFISPTTARRQPRLEMRRVRRGVWYTMIMYDPDAVGGTKIHWMITNIRIHEPGVTVLPYTPPNPPSGIHRYIIGLFEHEDRISPPRLAGRFIDMPFLLSLLGNPTIVDAFFFLSGY